MLSAAPHQSSIRTWQGRGRRSGHKRTVNNVLGAAKVSFGRHLVIFCCCSTRPLLFCLHRQPRQRPEVHLRPAGHPEGHAHTALVSRQREESNTRGVGGGEGQRAKGGKQRGQKKGFAMASLEEGILTRGRRRERKRLSGEEGEPTCRYKSTSSLWCSAGVAMPLSSAASR